MIRKSLSHTHSAAALRAVASPSERLVRDIRRATRKQYLAEEKICIVLDGLRDEVHYRVLRRREGIAESLYYSWPTGTSRLVSIARCSAPSLYYLVRRLHRILSIAREKVV